MGTSFFFSGWLESQKPLILGYFLIPRDYRGLILVLVPKPGISVLLKQGYFLTQQSGLT